jgi:hypothetical protein
MTARSRFASLTAGLLARKGEAMPASVDSHADDVMVRGQSGWTSPWGAQAAAPPPPSPPSPPPFVPRARLETAGYTFDATPAAAPVVRPVAAILPPPLAALPPLKPEDACGGLPTCGDLNLPDPSKRFHVSVRLRKGLYVRLKLAAAQLHRPSQDIVGDALTAYFATLDPELFGDCACLRDNNG